MFRPNLKSVLTRSWDSSDWRFGLQTPNLGKEEAVGGRGWYRPKERWWGLWVLRGNVSSIITRFRDIAAFVLQHTTFPNSPSGLLKISPCSPCSRWMAFRLRRAKMLGWLSVQLVAKFSDLRARDPPTLQTNRQTDRQHAISIPRFAL